MRQGKIIYRILLLALAVSNCVKQRFGTPSLAEFSTPAGSNTGIYYIPDSAGSIFKIPVGFTTATNRDRIVTFTVNSPTGAQPGRQYGIDSQSVRIPAGEVLASITVRGIFDGIPNERADTLLFALTGGDAAIFAANSTYTLILKRYCSVVLDEYSGDFMHCRDVDFYGLKTDDYPVNITAVPTGPFSARLNIRNLSAGYFGPFTPADPAMDPGITVEMDWHDPGNFTTVLPTQPFYVDRVYGPAKMNMSVGSFSACTHSLILKYAVVVAAGSFGSFVTTLEK